MFHHPCSACSIGHRLRPSPVVGYDAPGTTDFAAIVGSRHRRWRIHRRRRPATQIPDEAKLVPGRPARAQRRRAVNLLSGCCGSWLGYRGTAVAPAALDHDPARRSISLLGCRRQTAWAAACGQAMAPGGHQRQGRALVFDRQFVSLLHGPLQSGEAQSFLPRPAAVPQLNGLGGAGRRCRPAVGCPARAGTKPSTPAPPSAAMCAWARPPGLAARRRRAGRTHHLTAGICACGQPLRRPRATQEHRMAEISRTPCSENSAPWPTRPSGKTRRVLQARASPYVSWTLDLPDRGTRPTATGTRIGEAVRARHGPGGRHHHFARPTARRATAIQRSSPEFIPVPSSVAGSTAR